LIGQGRIDNACAADKEKPPDQEGYLIRKKDIGDEKNRMKNNISLFVKIIKIIQKMTIAKYNPFSNSHFYKFVILKFN
jgi:hypothetical protein